MSSFWQFFDSQMALFRRVSLGHTKWGPSMMRNIPEGKLQGKRTKGRPRAQIKLKNELAASSTNAEDWPKTEMSGVHSPVKPLTSRKDTVNQKKESHKVKIITCIIFYWPSIFLI